VKRGYVARATGDSHQAKNRRADAIAGTPTSGGVAQGQNIKAGWSRENGKTGQRSTHLQALKGTQVFCQYTVRGQSGW